MDKWAYDGKGLLRRPYGLLAMTLKVFVLARSPDLASDLWTGQGTCSPHSSHRFFHAILFVPYNISS